MDEAEDDHDLVQDPLQLLLRRLFVPCSQFGVDIFGCMEPGGETSPSRITVQHWQVANVLIICILSQVREGPNCV